jgi:signal transduction histidine kinase
VYWVTSGFASTIPLLVALLLLLFPDGRFLSRRWRPVGAAAVVLQAIVTVGGAFSEYAEPGEDGWGLGKPWLDNPLPVTIPGGDHWWSGVAWLLLMLCLVLAVCSFVARLRRGDPVQRQQLKWLLPPLGLVVVGFLGMELVGEDGTFWLLVPGLLALPAAIGIAILRRGLFDIDVLIRRSVVYSLLWLVVGTLYLVLAALPGLAVGERVPLAVAVALTILATLAFQPARRAVDRLVGRLLFGERPSEFELLSRFGETVADTFDVTELAPRVADTVRQGLDLEWARVSLVVGQGEDVRVEPAGATGIGLDEPASPTLVVPLMHAGERIGSLECGPKSDGRLSERDRALAGSLSRQAALGIHNVRLAAELAARLDEIGRQAAQLQASRSRLIAAQDQERQRLERDLHDGVQQDIVSLLARLGLARAQLRRDPATAETTLDELQAQTGQVLRDLRQLVQGIHPSVLTDHGLLEALEARLGQLPIGVRIHADRSLRGARFATDVEAAAYFFVSEGLTNAMKHAAPTLVSVRVGVEHDLLVIDVDDDGAGFVVPRGVQGSGLTGLRDRIEAVGGTMQVRSSPGAGCHLRALVPLSHRLSPEPL